MSRSQEWTAPPNMDEVFKTEICARWIAGKCHWGDRCQFAHGAHELQQRPRHNKYKTALCKTFVATGGECPYGQRCHFIHAFTLPETPLTMPIDERRDMDETKASHSGDCGGVHEPSPTTTNVNSPGRLADLKSSDLSTGCRSPAPILPGFVPATPPRMQRTLLDVAMRPVPLVNTICSPCSPALPMPHLHAQPRPLQAQLYWWPPLPPPRPVGLHHTAVTHCPPVPPMSAPPAPALPVAVQPGPGHCGRGRSSIECAPASCAMPTTHICTQSQPRSLVSLPRTDVRRDNRFRPATAPASPLPMRDLDQPAKPEEDELALELTALLVTMSVLE